MVEQYEGRPGMQHFGLRWVDDLVMFFASHDHLQDVDEDWQQYFSRMYHEDMELETEDHDGAFKFLDSWITINDDGSVDAKLYNKNTAEATPSCPQKFYRFPHGTSCTSEPVMVATAIGMFVNAERASSSPAMMKAGLTELVSEFQACRIPDPVITKALRHVKLSNRSGYWDRDTMKAVFNPIRFGPGT